VRTAGTVATGACSGAADTTVYAAAPNGTNRDGGHHTGRYTENITSAEGLAADGDEIGNTAADAQDAGCIPAAYDPIYSRVAAAEAV